MLALSFVDAIRQDGYRLLRVSRTNRRYAGEHAVLAMDRDYIVTYVFVPHGGCYGACCHRQKIIRSTGRAEARVEFLRRFPLADVIRVD